jgi:hypothetical protein
MAKMTIGTLVRLALPAIIAAMARFGSIVYAKSSFAEVGGCSKQSNYLFIGITTRLGTKIEMEVDESKNEQLWMVTFLRNNVTFFSDMYTTGEPDGSFMARKLVHFRSGTFQGVAVANRTGETCTTSMIPVPPYTMNLHQQNQHFDNNSNVIRAKMEKFVHPLIVVN